MRRRLSLAAASTAKGRESWVDLAKGLSILLVVLLHAQTALASGGWTGSAWATVMDALSTLRMPTFFLISGFFARRSFTAPASDFRVRKIWTFIWVFALWSLVYVSPLEILGHLRGDQGLLDKADRWLDETYMIDGVLWYLVALPVFFLCARLLRRVPVRVQITGAAALSFLASSSLIDTGQWGFGRMAANFFYFLAGCYFSASIRSAAVRAGWLIAFGLGLAWIGLSVVVYAKPWPALATGFLPHLGQAILPLLAVPFVLTTAPLIARWRWSQPLTWLGRNTLPVYVMHMAPISVIALVMQRAHVLSADSWLTGVLPILLMVVATAASLAVSPLLSRWAPWSFALPPALVRRDTSETQPRNTSVGARHRRKPRLRPPSQDWALTPVITQTEDPVVLGHDGTATVDAREELGRGG
jgi:uncharacterized membrane protein YcfT